MKRILLTTAGLFVLGVSLSACGGGGGGQMTTTTPPASSPFEDQFGSATGFGTAFRGSANTGEPRDVNDGDVVPVNPTAEPVWLPGT